MNENLQPTWDLMAHYGMAMWLAQSLEHAVQTWIVAAVLAESDQPRVDGDADPHFTRVSKMTLGQLIRLAVGDDEAFETDLRAGLAVRNDLAHRFGQRHATALIDETARSSAISDCVEACDVLRPITEEVTRRAYGTGIDTGGLDVDEAAEWAAGVVAARLEGSLDPDLGREIAQVISDAAPSTGPAKPAAS